MEAKYEWAQESNAFIQYEALYYRSYSDTRPSGSTDIPKLQQAFWSFLQAYQQIRSYHGVWLKGILGTGYGNQYMDLWKIKFLTPAQAQAWDLLRDLRNEDAHNEPLIPNISVKYFTDGSSYSAAYGPYGSSTSAGIGPKYIPVYGNKEVVIGIAGAEYNLLTLTTDNLLSMRKFIDTFDQVP